MDRLERARVFELPADAHPTIRTVYEYWRSVTPTGQLPGRQHIDPVDLPQLLPNLRLLDVIHDPIHFRARLVGERYCDFAGGNPTGLWLDEFMPNFHQSDHKRDLVLTVERKLPQWRRGRPYVSGFAKKDFITLERIHLPLAGDGQTVDMIFSAAVFGGDETSLF